MNWLTSLFKLFASLRLAIILIVLLGIAFGVGTFIESSHGARTAQGLIYQTNWLAILLFLLALNLLASALDRIPWKKKHTGFLTTHLGIILMLAGSLVTQAFGIEGQVQIREGTTESRMSLPKPLLQVIAVDSGQRFVFPFRQHFFPWTGKEKLSAEFAMPFTTTLVADYPKAKRNEEVREAQEGSPALHVSLKGSMASADDWLLLDHPEKGSIHLGPAIIRFSKDPIVIREQKKSNEWGTLNFNFESGSVHEIPLDSKSEGKSFPLGKMPYQIKVVRILKDAVVNGNELVEQSTEWRNPAIQLVLEGKNLSERHTVFAKFPEFPTLHGLKPSEAHVRIAYDVPQFASEMEKNEIRFVYTPAGEKTGTKSVPGLRPGTDFIRYQVKRGTDLKEGQVELGKEVETGWMDFKFSVASYFEHAVVSESYVPLRNISEDTEAIPVVQIEVAKGDEKKTLWLPQGEMAHFAFGDSNYHIVYGLETMPLGFQVELKDFMMDTDPGTERPASFKSQVKLKDLMKGIEREHLIQMNEPLKYRGFKLYQSAYHLEPGQPDVSIFTAAKDPGNPLKYAGAIVMTVGILMLFYMKQFSTLKSSDPKLRSR